MEGLLGFVGLEGEELRRFGGLITDFEENGLHKAVCGSVDDVFHLHGFQRHQRRALLDMITRGNKHGGYAAGHGREKIALLRVSGLGCAEGIKPRELSVMACVEHVYGAVYVDDHGLNA